MNGSVNVEEKRRREASSGIYTPSFTCRPHITSFSESFGSVYVDGGVGKTILIGKAFSDF